MPRIRKLLPLSAIRIDRIPLNPDTLALVWFLRNGGEVKPIKVQKVWIDKTAHCLFYNAIPFAEVMNEPRGHYEYHILDGRHRYTAYKLLGRTHIEVTFGDSHA